MHMNIKAVIFDKDGTLIDFAGTFNPATRLVLEHLSEGDAELMQKMADIWEFDLERNVISNTSMIIADSGYEIANALSAVIEIEDPEKFANELDDMFGELCLETLAELPGIRAALEQLKSAGIALGVGTNDSQANALRQMQALDFDSLFHKIMGADSGHGAKPGPGMVAAFIESLGLQPSEVLMVGDSLHDLEAGRSAGARTCGVETGPADRSALEKHADIVLSSVALLPAQLGVSV